jgi:hypothetical protein
MLRTTGGVAGEDVADACRFCEAAGLVYGEHFLAKNAIETAGWVILMFEFDPAEAAPEAPRKTKARPGRRS